MEKFNIVPSVDFTCVTSPFAKLAILKSVSSWSSVVLVEGSPFRSTSLLKLSKIMNKIINNI